MKVKKYQKGYRQENWNTYDDLVAKCHEAKYGVIYVDNYGYPLDDEWLLECIEKGDPIVEVIE